jgi:hypothetical protein
MDCLRLFIYIYSTEVGVSTLVLSGIGNGKCAFWAAHILRMSNLNLKIYLKIVSILSH